MIIVEIARRDMVEVPQAEDDKPIEALTTDRADPTLNERVLIRRPWRRRLDGDARFGEGLVEPLGVLEVTRSALAVCMP